ncbi:MAG: ParB N-terminal domain-containing protein [bacterium]|nr:ParB N-terminal domain-containing protein [bacterium]
MPNKKIPKIITDVGFDFDWIEEKVWKLQYPIEEINIEELVWHFDIPFWNKPHGFYDLKPINVIKNPKKYKKEYERTMQADLSHPIDIMKNKGKWLILDGLHRLVKLKILGKEKIRVRKIPRKEIKNISP